MARTESFQTGGRAITLLGLLGLATACSSTGSQVLLRRSFTASLRLQATDGQELCAVLSAQAIQVPWNLGVEFEILDGEGRPLPSGMPELADPQGRLRLRRELRIGSLTEERHRVCTFLPAHLRPDRQTPLWFRVRVRDEEGEVLVSEPLSLPPLAADPGGKNGRGAEEGLLR